MPPPRHSYNDSSLKGSAHPDSRPQAAYEHPPADDHGSPPGGAGGSSGGGGISAPPPVTAWAVPSASMPTSLPQAHAAPSPETFANQPSTWGGGADDASAVTGVRMPDAAGGGGGYSGGGEKGVYVDPVGGHEKTGGGWAAATKGWGPQDAGKGGVPASAARKEKMNDPPPPYTPYDIPSPPKDRPVSTRKFDIPAAPG